MRSNLVQPQGSTAIEVNIQSIARSFNLSINDVVYLRSGNMLTTAKVLFEEVSESLWWNTATGTVQTVTVANSTCKVVTDKGTYILLPAIPGSGLSWVYNQGSANGGENTLTPPYTFNSVSAIYINGSRQTEGYSYSVSAGVITLGSALKSSDFVQVILNVDGSALMETLSGNQGAGQVGTSSGQTVQQQLDTLNSDNNSLSTDVQVLEDNQVKRTDLTTYYIASTGNDSNVGNQANPFLTLQAAINKVMSGSVFQDVTINVGPGSFDGATIQGALYNGARIIITGDSIATTTFTSPITVTRRSDVKLQNVGTTSQFGVEDYGSLEVAGAQFGTSTEIAHLYCDSGHLKITEDYSVLGPSANFHVWVRGNGRLDVAINTTITNTPTFQYFVYFEEGSSIYCKGWNFIGSTIGGRYVITENAVVIAGTTSATERDSFFPGTHGDTVTDIVDQPNVGGRFDGYPDYGFTTLFSISASDLSTVEFAKIPDCFSYIILKWYGVDLSDDSATFNVQVKPVGETDYVTDTSYYQKIDIMNNSSQSNSSSASLINIQPKISSGATPCYGSIQIPGFQGGAYPLVNGCYTDNANIFHTIQGIFLNPNWLRNIRFITSSGTFTSGTFELIAFM